MKLVELIERVGTDAEGSDLLTPRLVRFLITEGVLHPPRGGRAKADYGEDHLARVRRYFQLRDLGIAVKKIAEIVTGEFGDDAVVDVVPGLKLQITPAKLGRPLDPQVVADRVAEILAQFVSEETEDADRC